MRTTTLTCPHTRPKLSHLLKLEVILYKQTHKGYIQFKLESTGELSIAQQILVGQITYICNQIPGTTKLTFLIC
jgi:hypothetical protein